MPLSINSLTASINLCDHAPKQEGALGIENLQEVDAAQVETVRAFNRFYTRQIGLLEEGLLQSDFSLTEVRVLYELARGEKLTASELSRELGLDPGYLSRIIRKFEANGYLSRQTASNDARQSLLNLTEEGRKAFAPLNTASHDQVRRMLSAVHPGERDALIVSMQRIRRFLGGDTESKVPYILRAPAPGDIGWIIHRQGLLYFNEYGWDESFEGLVAEIAGTFVRSLDPRRERCWIAEKDGEIVGSIFLSGGDTTTAKLRLLYVEPSARGLGIGDRLVSECIKFARGCGYKIITLWTNDVLISARRIYQAHGFELVKEEKHHSFGKDLVGQTWELAL